MLKDNNAKIGDLGCGQRIDENNKCSTPKIGVNVLAQMDSNKE